MVSDFHTTELLTTYFRQSTPPPPPRPAYIMNRVQNGINTKTRGSTVFVLLTFKKKMLEIGKEVGKLYMIRIKFGSDNSSFL